MNKQLNKGTYYIKGVSVDKYIPSQVQSKPNIIMVHGGEHGSWCWERWANYFCGAGYEVHVLNWYNHGDSDILPQATFITRSLVDVAHKEITYVAEQFDHPPILIGHSMGGLASAVYATRALLDHLVLVAPVLPAIVKPDPIPLPVDSAKPFPAFPYPQAKELFFTTLDETEARQYTTKLVAESPQAVIEATQWTIDIDLTTIKVSTFVIGTELDRLIPRESLKYYAQLLKAKYKEMPAIGHSDILLKDPQWHQAAEAVKQWLEK